jgi:CRP-like cAMP-binding protein
MSFKANSVIYFNGDMSDKIYILKSGKVGLNGNDIETGQETHDYIQTGEFFGVKSALGKYPREENAVVLADSSVIVFTVPEFEAVVSSNTRIIMKMLKVFSNQLRRIHLKVRNLIATEEQLDPQTGLFNVAEYYMKKRRYAQALYAYNRYLTYYPSGTYHAEANKQAQLAEQYASTYGNGKGPTPQTSTPRSAPPSGGGKEVSSSARKYYDAVSSFSQQKYEEALERFRDVAGGDGDREYVVKSLYEIGRCLFNLNKYESCVKHFTSLIQRYPKLSDLDNALYYVGQSYRALDDADRAGSFFKKIISMPSASDPVRRKAQSALQEL